MTTPELYAQYPLLLITGVKQPMYYHSQGRQIPSLRELAPEPLAEIHNETAAALGISAGDFAWVQTPRGKLRLKVHIHDRIHPKVVTVQHGWWLAERPGAEHGVLDLCANVLTDDDPDNCDVVFGGSPLKAMLCRVYRAETAQ